MENRQTSMDRALNLIWEEISRLEQIVQQMDSTQASVEQKVQALDQKVEGYKLHLESLIFSGRR